MVPLTGSHVHSTDGAIRHKSNAVDVAEAMHGFWVEAPERGKHGIYVYALEVNDDGMALEPRRAKRLDNGDKELVQTLPPVAGRFEKPGDGLQYLIPWEGGQYVAPATELHKRETWVKLGYRDASKWTAQHGWYYLDIWYEVAHRWPLAPPSPRVTEGVPPLGPDLAPLTEDVNAARRAWAALAHRMTPTARLIVGMTLMSPWIDRCGAESSVMSVWGTGGNGKSMTAVVCAALYGDTEPNAGLFTDFNSAPQALGAMAQQHAYYPMILDEAASASADVEAQLTNLVKGAMRKRANRSGALTVSKARWGGLVLVTSNEPLELKHEMFDRRRFEVESSDLWVGLPSDPTERAAYWDEVAANLDVMAGWPWLELCREFTPGEPSALDVRETVGAMPLPGADSAGKVARLGVLGCTWLADWTGEDAWADDAHDAAVAMCARQHAAKRDDARDASAAILASWVTAPAMWEADANSREAYGYQASVPGAVCSIPHEGESCVWLDIYSTAFGLIVDVPQRRLAATRFKAALHLTEAEGLTRKVLKDRRRYRVVTACTVALEALAESKPQAEALALSAPKAAPMPKAEPTTATFAPATEAPADSVAPSRARSWAVARDGEGMADALDRAEREGATDLVGFGAWGPRDLSNGWDAGAWQGLGSGSAMIRRGGAAIRVWRTPDADVTPTDYLAAVTDFMARTGRTEWTSVPALGQTLVREGKRDNRQEPRWQLHEAQADEWRTANVLHPRKWGTKPSSGVVRYDRNRSFLGAITQANLAPIYRGEEWTHYGSDAPVDRRYGGMYRVRIPDWSSPLPAPHANVAEGNETWTTPEVMRLYAELGYEQPTILEAWLAPTHAMPHLFGFTEQVKAWLAEHEGTSARMIDKALYQSFAGNLTGEHNRDKPGRIYRPDWGNAIADNSWANVLRRVYKIHAADPRFIPTHVNVDAIYYPDDLPMPPGLPMGTGLGAFKFEGEARPVGYVEPGTYEAAPPVVLPDYYEKADF